MTLTHLRPRPALEKPRSYIEKGEAPLFFEFSVEGALVHDRVPAPARAALEELVREQGRVVVPQANRGGIHELVALAQDEEQSLYRVLWLERGGRPDPDQEPFAAALSRHG